MGIPEDTITLAAGFSTSTASLESYSLVTEYDIFV